MGTVISVLILSLAILAVAGLDIAAAVEIRGKNTSKAEDLIITASVVAVVSFVVALLVLIFLF